MGIHWRDIMKNGDGLFAPQSFQRDADLLLGVILPVWRRMSLTIVSADTFWPISLLLYLIQWVEKLLYSSLALRPSRSETEHRKNRSAV